MDSTENVSPRILLRNIISTQQPQTPITRRTLENSSVRRSNRRTTQTQSVQDILKRNIKDKVRESITRRSVTTKRAPSERLKQRSTPGPASLLYDESDTPRHLLRNILLTEPAKSPVHREEHVPDEPQQPLSSSNITQEQSNIEYSNLDLPDLTIANVGTTQKGLSRKRRRLSPNVTAFEKRLQDQSGFQRGHEEGLHDHSSLSSSSSTTLSLKTPFVDVQTEKKGLQRRLQHRRKITVEEFSAALGRFQSEENQEKTDFLQKDFINTASEESFALSLDVTSDILKSNQADSHQVGAGNLVEETGSNEDNSSNMDRVPLGSKPEVEEAVHYSDEDGGVGQNIAYEEEYLNDHQELVAPSEHKDGAKSQIDCGVQLAQEEEEEEDDGNTSEELKRISRRSHRSIGELITRVNEEEDSLPETAEADQSNHVSISLETGGHKDSPRRSLTPDLVESSIQNSGQAQETEDQSPATKSENVLLEMTHASERESLVSDSILAEEEEEAAIPASESIEVNEESEDNSDDSDEIPCKTPAFVKEKRKFFIGKRDDFPPVLPNTENSNTGKVEPATMPKQIRRKRKSTGKDLGLPRSYLMSVFRHFAKAKVSPDIYPVLKDIMNSCFDRMAKDLESYAHHAKRKTIEMEDAVLLLKRQGYVNDKVPVEVLIEKYLRMEQRKILIPIATSGNVVTPKQRR